MRTSTPSNPKKARITLSTSTPFVATDCRALTALKGAEMYSSMLTRATIRLTATAATAVRQGWRLTGPISSHGCSPERYCQGVIRQPPSEPPYPSHRAPAAGHQQVRPVQPTPPSLRHLQQLERHQQPLWCESRPPSSHAGAAGPSRTAIRSGSTSAGAASAPRCR